MSQSESVGKILEDGHRVITKERTLLVQEPRLLVRRAFPQAREGFDCLYQAVALQIVLGLAGLKTMLQAGTAQWPYLRREEDDGKGSTHFAYKWEGPETPVNAARIREGQLPEFHCWVAHRDPDTIIDPTTSTWPIRARIGGYQWTNSFPPDYLWVTTEGLKDLSLQYGFQITYAPALDACQIASEFAHVGGIYDPLDDILSHWDPPVGARIEDAALDPELQALEEEISGE